MSAQRGASSDCCVRCVNWTLVQTMNGRVTRVPCHYASWDYWSVGICYQERRCSARTRSGRTGSIGNQVCAWPLPLFPILYPLSHRPRRRSEGRGGPIFFTGAVVGGGGGGLFPLPFSLLSTYHRTSGQEQFGHFFEYLHVQWSWMIRPDQTVASQNTRIPHYPTTIEQHYSHLF